jgi:hypothetical protein
VEQERLFDQATKTAQINTATAKQESEHNQARLSQLPALIN